MTEKKNSPVSFIRQNLVLVGIVALVVVTSIVQPKFLGATNLTNVMRQLWPLPFVALGMTFVIIGGFIDLSVVGIISLCSVITMYMINPLGQVGAMLLGILAGAVLGYLNGFILTTFGDMLRVPGSETSLERVRAEGGDVRVVYSTMDALAIARENPDKKVVFFGIGFETTAPTVAAALVQARDANLDNFAVVSAHKTVPRALETLASNPQLSLKGFICPGHVSVIIGSRAYLPIAERRGIPCVITGFEPLDLLQGILMLAEQSLAGRAEVSTQYSRTVTEEGNLKAQALIDEVFETSDSVWRGIGEIPGSGLSIRHGLERFDAEIRWPQAACTTRENPGCRCAEVLTGLVEPPECPLFRKVCAPESPVGACMVSSEGTCAAYYKYGDELD